MLSLALPITTTLLKKILFHNPALPVPIFHAAIIEKATQIPMSQWQTAEEVLTALEILESKRGK